MLVYVLLLSISLIIFIPAFADESFIEDSYIFEYQIGSLKFDTELNGLTCDDIVTKPMVKTGRSLNIDEMDDYFFISLAKTDSSNYHYLEIQLPDNKGNENRESYILDFKKQEMVMRGGLYQDYPHLAVYLETDKEPKEINSDNYKRFLVGQSKNVIPSSSSFGPGLYDFHAILFQSDKSGWIKNEVCAISIHWPVFIDDLGNITSETPQTQVGRIYEIKKEITTVFEEEKSKDISNSNLDESPQMNGGNQTTVFANHALGEIEWTEKSTTPDGYGVIKLMDADMNINSTRVDVFEVSVFSNSTKDSVDLAMVESDINSGIFFGDLDFSLKQTLSHTLKVSNGDLVVVSYEDKTIPNTIHEDTVIVTDTLAIIQIYSSPFEQLKNGVILENISCMVEGHELFIKENSKPLCLTKKTYDKLVERDYF